MKPTQAVKAAARIGWDALEDVAFEKTTKPIISEIGNELGAFFGTRLGRNPQAIAQEDLERARVAKQLEKDKQEDDTKSREKTSQIIAAMQREYQVQESRTTKEQAQTRREVGELQAEVAKLAKAAGEQTRAHLEQMPKKVGVLDIKRLTTIIKFLRIKAEESKAARDLVAQRANAKPATGMLAWVSGKQMKVHEQGTLQLQG